MQKKGKIVWLVFLGIVLVGLFAFSSNTVSANSMPYEADGSIGKYDTSYYWLLNVQASDTVLIAIAPETYSWYYSSVFDPNLTLVEETGYESGSHSYELIANETGNYLLKFWTSSYSFNYTVKSSHGLTSEPPIVIGTPSQNPPRDNVMPYQEVKVSVSVTGGEGGVKNVTLFYTINNGTSWEPLRQMNYNSTTGYYETTIPGQPAYTWVKFKIVAYDYAGNNATRDGIEPYCVYQVIPEFPSLIILPLFMMATLLAAIVYRKKCPIGK